MRKTTLTLIVLLFAACSTSVDSAKKQGDKSNIIELPVPQRPAGQQDVLKLRAAPMDTVRIAVIGLGNRGADAARRLTRVPGTKIVALCDLDESRVEASNRWRADNNLPQAKGYFGDADAWKKAVMQADVDLVYITTGWDEHTMIAVGAMEAGKHAAIEVPAAMSVEECWDLVNTSEKTRKHCIMLENCIYDDFELMTLNMAQQGVLGEIVHVEGAYIHDLRSGNFSPTAYKNMWRLRWNATTKGDLYPTHGLGPVAMILGIHRGDRMTHLVAMGSNQFGMTKYAKDHFADTSKFNRMDYNGNDHTSTTIMTEKGKTITVQHDVTSPRPYSRIHQISGTKGFAQKWPSEGIALEGEVDLGNGEVKNFWAHEYIGKEDYAKIVEKYRHPFQKEMGEEAAQKGGHGGMDYIMDYRLVYCLLNGLPLDMDVYDAAEWSSLTELTRISIENNSAPVAIPDFTRGSWNKLEGVTYEVVK